MLKLELEQRLNQAELKIAELRIDNTKLTAKLHGNTEELKGLYEQSDNHYKQMEQISQSIRTMLRVKYPENEPMDLSPGAANTAWTPDTEEKRFLLFLLELSRNQYSNDFKPGHIYLRNY